MVLERWRPPATMYWRPSRLLEETERLMEEAFGGWPFRTTWRRMPAEEMGWAPSVEMYEKEDAFIVRAELPGVNKDDVDISVTGDILTIKGERKAPQEVKSEEYHRCEVCYGPFSRSIPMPASVEAGKVEASYSNGILEIRLPKAKEAMPHRIQIRA
ncbi:MAG: Hsp20/alpha crystallin family protein [Chloroflexi bacterium]|nr:MAG: Hsp20/alpha crystallin family protein [Chloroflexota bacterium]